MCLIAQYRMVWHRRHGSLRWSSTDIVNPNSFNTSRATRGSAHLTGPSPIGIVTMSKLAMLNCSLRLDKRLLQVILIHLCNLLFGHVLRVCTRDNARRIAAYRRQIRELFLWRVWCRCDCMAWSREDIKERGPG